jgi:hypothetical protein
VAGAFDEPFTVDGTELYVTASVGVALSGALATDDGDPAGLPSCSRGPTGPPEWTGTFRNGTHDHRLVVYATRIA